MLSSIKYLKAYAKKFDMSKKRGKNASETFAER